MIAFCLKKYFSILICLVYFVHLSFAFFYTVYFYTFRQNIAEKYCVNKNRPELHCEGYCHYKKEISNFENNDEQKNSKTTDVLEMIFLPVMINISGFRFIIPDHGIINKNFFDQPIDNFFSEIFHPPCVTF